MYILYVCTYVAIAININVWAPLVMNVIMATTVPYLQVFQLVVHRVE